MYIDVLVSGGEGVCVHGVGTIFHILHCIISQVDNHQSEDVPRDLHFTRGNYMNV